MGNDGSKASASATASSEPTTANTTTAAPSAAPSASAPLVITSAASAAAAISMAAAGGGGGGADATPVSSSFATTVVGGSFITDSSSSVVSQQQQLDSTSAGSSSSSFLATSSAAGSGLDAIASLRRVFEALPPPRPPLLKSTIERAFVGRRQRALDEIAVQQLAATATAASASASSTSVEQRSPLLFNHAALALPLKDTTRVLAAVQTQQIRDGALCTARETQLVETAKQCQFQLQLTKSTVLARSHALHQVHVALMECDSLRMLVHDGLMKEFEEVELLVDDVHRMMTDEERREVLAMTVVMPPASSSSGGTG